MKDLLYQKHKEKFNKKTIKIPVSYSKREVENILRDKEFIEIYQDFNL